MLNKEKREKGATTPSSPHDATPPATPPTVKEERKEDEGVTPSPKQPATPKQPQKQEEDDLDKVAPPPDAEATEAPPFSGGGGSIQPLVSNLMGKQSGGGLEYMQQSSQIFVFSTTLANKGAESVLSGHFPSIIAYHCAQPGTKKILEKHPLKLGQFNRHAPWNLMGAFSQKPRGGGGPKPPAGAMLDPQDADADTDEWSSEPLKSGLTDEMANGGGGAGVSPAAASLVQGVKVPDENLTPQQRQHREEQLAMIRKMHLMLFPEQSDADAATMQDVEEKLANEMANRQMAHMADFLPCPTPMAAPGYKGGGGADWTRLQHHYCEERKGGRAAPQRAHGPPPPYHQTPRSASVPIATHSPSPNSPQNLTSTLSLPSPRGGGGGGALASPSDSRHAPMRHLTAGQSPASAGSPAAMSRPLTQSSPATPQSAHLSPCGGGGGFKDVDLPPPDDKAPPPPSSPARTPSRGDGGALKVEHAPSPGIQCSPASQTPHDKAPPTFFADISPEAGGNAEHVSIGAGGGGGGSFSLPDDNMPLNPDTSVAPETTKVMPFDPISSLAQMSQQLTNTTPPFNGGGPPGGPNGAVMAAQISTCSYGQEMTSQQQQQQEEMLECAQLHGMMVSASDMVGLHSAPYGKILPPTAGKPLSPKMVTGGVHGVGGFGGGQMARMGSPAGRLCPPASLADSYNGGASVQVRASAPNTIQYLPARPQLCPQMPRPPPSLDFLQRFANPMHSGGDRGRHDVMNGMFHEHPGGGGMFQGGGPPLRHAPPFHSPDKLMEPPPPTSQSYVGGPTTTDPNYAQQFHNFQQQLYATTTRISTTQGGAPPQTYFINK